MEYKDSLAYEKYNSPGMENLYIFPVGSNSEIIIRGGGEGNGHAVLNILTWSRHKFSFLLHD